MIFPTQASMMLVNSAVYRVPQELWTMIFDELTLSTLIQTSYVCSAWRACAFDHPTFWKSVTFDRRTCRHVNWALYRLAAARGRPHELHLDLSGSPLPAELAGLVMHLIRSLLPRLTALSITLDANHYQDLEHALATPAPLLEYFSLTLCAFMKYEPTNLPLLPSLFLDHAPRLTSVKLVDVALPPRPIPAFCGVTDVTLSLRYQDVLDCFFLDLLEPDDLEAWYEFPGPVFTVFPAIKNLHVRGGCFKYDGINPETCAHLESLESLRLELVAERACDVFLDHVPTQRIRDLTIDKADDAAVFELMSQLPQDGFFELYISQDTDVDTFSDLFLTLRKPDQRPDMTRTFCIPKESTTLSYIAPVIVFLNIPASLWGMLPAMTFPFLQIITIQFDGDGPSTQTLPRWDITCPEIRLLNFEDTRSCSAINARCILDVLRSFEYVPTVPYMLKHLRVIGPAEEVAEATRFWHQPNTPEVY